MGNDLGPVGVLVEGIAVPWVVNSLAQVVLKSTVPGLPDVYQGTELWDFSLVDPDNRRPVDFARRLHALNEMPGDVAQLLSDWRDGGIKLHTLQRVLSFRQSHPALFAEGDYVPLAAKGWRSSHVVAFARRAEGEWAWL